MNLRRTRARLRPSWRRGPLVVLVCTLLAAATAGCSSGGSPAADSATTPSQVSSAQPSATSSSDGPAFVDPDTYSPSSSPVPAADPSALDTIGSYRSSTAGETVTSTIAVGQPILPSDSQVADRPCGPASSPQKLVSIRGSVTIQYQGAIAGSVSLDQTRATIGSLLAYAAGGLGYAAFQGADGSWFCDGQGPTFTMQPGQSVVVAWWADLDVISDAQPTFTAAEQTSLYLQFHAYATDQAANPTLTASGSGAANCDQTNRSPDVLLLYAHPPQTHHAKDVYGSDQTTVCTTA